MVEGSYKMSAAGTAVMNASVVIDGHLVAVVRLGMNGGLRRALPAPLPKVKGLRPRAARDHGRAEDANPGGVRVRVRRLRLTDAPIDFKRGSSKIARNGSIDLDLARAPHAGDRRTSTPAWPLLRWRLRPAGAEPYSMPAVVPPAGALDEPSYNHHQIIVLRQPRGSLSRRSVSGSTSAPREEEPDVRARRSQHEQTELHTLSLPAPTSDAIVRLAEGVVRTATGRGWTAVLLALLGLAARGLVAGRGADADATTIAGGARLWRCRCLPFFAGVLPQPREPP